MIYSFTEMGKEVIYTDEAFTAESLMNKDEKTEFNRLVQLLEETGRLSYPFAEKVEGEDNLFTIRIRKGGNFREFYAYDDGTSVWLLNGYEKKTATIPRNELRQAKRLKRKYGL